MIHLQNSIDLPFIIVRNLAVFVDFELPTFGGSPPVNIINGSRPESGSVNHFTLEILVSCLFGLFLLCGYKI